MQIYLHCLCVDTIFTSAKVLKIFDIGKFWGGNVSKIYISHAIRPVIS